jgi:WD40 repeat protein
MLKSYVGRTCPFCVTGIQEGVEVLICSVCSKPHHSDCWMYNLNRCTTFGCKGTALHPEFIIENLAPEEEKKPLPQLKPTIFKPLPNLKPAAKKIDTSLVGLGPRAVRLNPLSGPVKNAPRPREGSRDLIVQKPKKPGELGKVPRTQGKIPANISKGSPRPDPFVPDYVYKEFVREMEQPIRRAFYKPDPLPEMFMDKPLKFSSTPIPEAFVPDYVNEKLKSVPGWTKGEQSEKKQPYKPSFNFSKILRKAVDNDVYEPIPKPEPFIPDYVYGELPVKGRRKMLKMARRNHFRLPFIKNDNFSKKSGNQGEEIPKPDPYIPDYVYADQENWIKSLFAKEIIFSVRCPHCSKYILENVERCPYCKMLLGERPITKVLQENSSIITPDIIVSTESGIEYSTMFVNAKKIKSLCFSPDGQFISYGSSDKTVKIWDINTKQCIKTLNEHSDAVTSVCFNPSGQLIASGSSDKTVRVWEIFSEKCFRVFEGNPMGVEALVCSPNGKYVVSAAGYGTIRVWDIYSKVCITKAETPTPSWLDALAYSPSGNFIATGNAEMMVNVWDIISGACLISLRGHLDFVNSVNYSPDGLYLASGSNDRTIKIWEIQTEKCLKTISGHEDKVNSVVYSPDGRYLASASNDKTIRLWDPWTGDCFRVFTGHAAAVNSVVYSPDGRYLASGSEDKTIRIWQLF